MKHKIEEIEQVGGDANMSQFDNLAGAIQCSKSFFQPFHFLFYNVRRVFQR